MNLAAFATAPQEEVARQMGVCNACRYCEGLCAVFPAMELRRVFERGDADYLSNLCHNCGSCWTGCQYASPHPFAVDVPAAMAANREESWQRHAWPPGSGALFERHGAWIAALSVVAVTALILGFALWSDPGVLASGNFYAVMPHDVMVAVFAPVFLFSILAMALSVRRLWRASGPVDFGWRDIGRAIHDAATLRYLEGGGAGCVTRSEKPDPWRRRFHHFAFWGFVLCFASTSSGTVAHYVFGDVAPYEWWHPVKVLGVLGGIGLVVGAGGLLWESRRRADALRGDRGLGEAFTWTLLGLGATGLALWLLRGTPLMGVLLAVHLGVVFAFFLTMPYGKFVHGLHRTAALVRHAAERRREEEALAPAPGKAA